MHSDWSRGVWTTNQKSEFSQTCGFRRNFKGLQYIHTLQKSTYGWIRFLPKHPQTLIWGHFVDFLGPLGRSGLFLKNQAPSFFLLYNSLTWCKQSEKKLMNHFWDLALPIDGWTDKGKDGQMDRGIDPNSWDTFTTRVGLELNITKDPQMQSSENFEKFISLQG